MSLVRAPRATSRARRLAAMPGLLRAKPRTTRELAERFGVPVRTVQRDLETLREMGEGVEEVRRGLHAIPGAESRLSAVEALATHAAARLLYHHAPVHNPFYLSALREAGGVAARARPDGSMAKQRGAAGAPRDDRSLELVARAWFEGRVLVFEYRSPGGSDARAKRPA